MSAGFTSDLPGQWRSRCAVVGFVGVGLMVLGFLVSRGHFYSAYLQGFGFVLAVSLGCLGLRLLHGLVGGTWGMPLLRFFEAGARTLPLMVILFVPILLGAKDVYLWARPEAMHDEVLRSKEAWLNLPAFSIRSIIYFVVWIGLAFAAGRNDKAAGGAAQKASPSVGAVGLVLFVLTVSFAAFDWFMSIEPHWFSSIYGAIYLASALVSTFSTMAILILLFRRPLAADAPAFANHLHDVGKLMLMSVMVFAYFAFSQYLIIWSAQIAEETPWYVHRMKGGWDWLGLIVLIGHFFVPFFLLLSRSLKRQVVPLARIAVGLLIMHYANMIWSIAPAYSPQHLSLSWLDFVAPLAFGGLWAAVFFHYLQFQPFPVVASSSGGSTPGFMKEGAHGPQDRP